MNGQTSLNKFFRLAWMDAGNLWVSRTSIKPQLGNLIAIINLYLGTSLSRCQQTCGTSNRLLWPLPRTVTLSNDVTAFDPSQIEIVFDPPVENVDIESMLKTMVNKRRDALVSAAVKDVSGNLNAAALVLQVSLGRML